MKLFLCEGKDPDGNPVRAIILAEDQDEAMGKLRGDLKDYDRLIEENSITIEEIT
ncbi:hypothetical protein [Clostridium hydrogeniformans]|uniref:hypothetical protein n=1 Tax=Clostridium hydrogeniformans TaxID=349933 RepID=UPI000B1C0507|nr:hypothetical protein [Clostridium hydrogeniformans]